MDELLLGARVLLSLGAVLAILWLAQRRLGRNPGALQGTPPVEVIARQGIGQKAAVVIMDSGGQRFTLGVTEQSVTVLHREDAPVRSAGPAPRTGGRRRAGGCPSDVREPGQPLWNRFAR